MMMIDSGDRKGGITPFFMQPMFSQCMHILAEIYVSRAAVFEQHIASHPEFCDVILVAFRKLIAIEQAEELNCSKWQYEPLAMISLFLRIAAVCVRVLTLTQLRLEESQVLSKSSSTFKAKAQELMSCFIQLLLVSPKSTSPSYLRSRAISRYVNNVVSSMLMIPKGDRDTLITTKIADIQSMKDDSVVIKRPGLHYVCDFCGTKPILGTRWRCTDAACSNFDLCDKCHSTVDSFPNLSHKATHQMAYFHESKLSSTEHLSSGFDPSPDLNSRLQRLLAHSTESQSEDNGLQLQIGQQLSLLTASHGSIPFGLSTADSKRAALSDSTMAIFMAQSLASAVVSSTVFSVKVAALSALLSFFARPGLPTTVRLEVLNVIADDMEKRFATLIPSEPSTNGFLQKMTPCDLLSLKFLSFGLRKLSVLLPISESSSRNMDIDSSSLAPASSPLTTSVASDSSSSSASESKAVSHEVDSESSSSTSSSLSSSASGSVFSSSASLSSSSASFDSSSSLSASSVIDSDALMNDPEFRAEAQNLLLSIMEDDEDGEDAEDGDLDEDGGEGDGEDGESEGLGLRKPELSSMLDDEPSKEEKEGKESKESKESKDSKEEKETKAEESQSQAESSTDIKLEPVMTPSYKASKPVDAGELQVCIRFRLLLLFFFSEIFL
jgi:hypothetical protein